VAENKDKIDRIHDAIPRHFKTRANPNWKALVEAFGGSDQQLTDLIEEVRRQFFVKTASRPYLDRLGSNFQVSRPQYVGMDDPTFRRYIPVLAYQPKQVKLILDQLLDIFFFKESTAAFTQSQGFELFDLKDGWELEYTVDRTKTERIIFDASDFADINNAKAEEIVAAINRNAEYSFAVVFDDRVLKRKFIRIFTNTVGSKGSIQVTGGRANIELQFIGFNDIAGSKGDTQWSITKVGDTMTFQHIGGLSPNLQAVQVGQIVIIDIPGNEGSFVVTEVDLSNSTFSFVNPFGTVGSHDHSLSPDTYVNFMTAEQLVIYTRENRAVVWETSPGQIIVEMPASPPVVKRALAGSAHINGVVSTVSERVDDSTLLLSDAEDWPLNGGKFVLQERQEIQHRHLNDFEDTITVSQFETRFDKQQIYAYTTKVGNELQGISPNLPILSELFESTITSVQRSADGVLTISTSTDHGLADGESVRLQNIVSDLSTTGIRADISIGDTATDVATKVASVIDGVSDFSAFSLGNVVTVTNAANGVTTDCADVDSGVSVNVIQQGTAGLPEITEITVDVGTTYDVAGNGLRFNINSADDVNQYHVWFNTIDGTNSQINAGLDDIPSGTFEITEIIDSDTFTINSLGEGGNGNGGLVRLERIGMADAGSLAYLTSAQLDTGIVGPNIWDTDAAFVLSSLTSNIQQEIKSGSIVRSIQVESTNNIPDEEGFVIFDFGTEDQEGPVRYLYKPTDSSIQMDPAYIFKNNHDVGSSVTVIRRRGAHVISTTGKEYALYLTDPGTAREILQELLRDVKSVGIFIDFLIRFPQQLYSTLDVYRSGSDSLYPITQEDE